MITTNHPPTVDFIIPAESAQAVVTLLLSNKIAFSLTFSNCPETILKEVKVKQSNDTGSEFRKITFEAIYRKYIEESMEQMPPKESQIATEFGMPLTAFKIGFKEVYGKPFYQLYMEKRMEYAKTLLLEGLRAAKVAELVGYAQPIKFNKMFQKHYGITPKKYQVMAAKGA